MKNIFICADGGCYGNFLAVLVRLAYDANYLKKHYGDADTITKTGAADFISGAGTLLKYIEDHGFDRAERQQNVDEIVRLYNDKSFEYLTDVVYEYDRTHCHIALGHFVHLQTVKKLLSVSDLKIIYVTFEQKDCKLIAQNKITKNFDPKSPSFGDWVINFLIYNNAGEEYIQEFYLTKESGIISDKLRSKLLELWELNMRKKVPSTVQVRQEIKDDRVLFIRIDEILKDRDQLLNKITTFVQKETNDELIEFYEKFKSAQKMYHMYQV
jgi:hypothetical protein